MSQIAPVLEFLPCRTPGTWLSWALSDLPTLLLDHAGLEMKAAQQAQTVMRRYAVPPRGSDHSGVPGFELLNKMSRLAREELRHFEQVLAIVRSRGIDFYPVSASRYAAALHAQVRGTEPDRLVDTLIVGALIEARSCERFYSLLPGLESTEPELARFYESLLKSEARHFADYLTLAGKAANGSVAERTKVFLKQEAELIMSPDSEMRFHSGVPA